MYDLFDYLLIISFVGTFVVLLVDFIYRVIVNRRNRKMVSEIMDMYGAFSKKLLTGIVNPETEITVDEYVELIDNITHAFK